MEQFKMEGGSSLGMGITVVTIHVLKRREQLREAGHPKVLVLLVPLVLLASEVGFTLSLYSTLMILQFSMEGSTSEGMGMTLVNFSSADGGMGSPTSLRRSLVLTFRFPFAKKVCFL
ncbi:hypothetical protein EYF80_058034 [Liparis tanakae]|uniref:Uncharacterized protein n=1 Tax=Liparis tanakae TaxID=230148 RepID=A0A4Z2ESB1_9TELE|nr:hypothetical protein EYF80_058034 [Liparis tanakae]